MARPKARLARVALAALLGALQTLAYIHTEAWWLPPITAGLLAWLASRATPGQAAWLGWSYGTAWLCAGTGWLFISLHRYGGLPAWMAVAAVFALSAFLSLYLAAALAAFARWRAGRAAADVLLFAAVWALAEWARGVIFTGFPWVASGYAQVDSPLAPLAPWVGVYGLGALATGLAAWVALAHGTAWRRGAVGLLLVAGLTLGGRFTGPLTFTRPAASLDVTLLQGNVPQEEKFASEHQGAALEWHVRQLLAAGGDLVIAPETAIPFLPQQLPDGFWAGLQAGFASGGLHALFGVPQGDDVAGYTNSAIGLAPGQPAYRYDKHHLVPFGEFIPFGFKWFTRMMNIPLGDFERGPLVAPSFNVRGVRVAPNICYEDLFGEELAARFTDPAQAPAVFANLSNIGWFGESIAIGQHLQISRMRALEFQRPMLRATNTGATAFIDHRGRVTHGLAPHTRGALRGTVQGRDGVTPFAWWAGRFGLWPLVALALGTVLWRARAARRGGRP